MTGLRDDPQPAYGMRLGCNLAPGRKVWRLRLDAWRVVYMIDRDWGGVHVLAVRKRPPYQYEDLPSLVGAG